MAKKILDVRRYTMPDQRRFAELSGDLNPLHLDPVGARREFFGDVVVHGVHGLLRALDAYCASLGERGVTAIVLRRLTVRFPAAVYLNQRVKTYLVDERDGHASLQAHDGKQMVLHVELRWDRAAEPRSTAPPAAPPGGVRSAPLSLAFDKLAGRRGELDLYVAPDPARAEFPHLVALASVGVVAELLGLTRLIGMECPGLRSMFFGFDAQFGVPARSGDVLAWEVTSVNPGASMLKIAVRGPTMSGVVDALYRPPPQKQADMAEVSKVVTPGVFTGQLALVVGGSRGLGEVTAKIVAAGGGHAVITYHRGAEDAERVAAEIRAAGADCDILPCDVSRPAKAVATLARSDRVPTHIYYFASPKIFVRKGKSYSGKLFRTFAAFYVDGLVELYEACRSSWPDRHLSFFYPSSTALDEKVKDLGEYIAAKAAGEAICAHLAQLDRKLSVFVKRLPRIATDQTTTLMHYPAANALDIMWDTIREMSQGRV